MHLLMYFIFYLFNVGNKNMQKIKKKMLIKANGPLKLCMAADVLLI